MVYYTNKLCYIWTNYKCRETHSSFWLFTINPTVFQLDSGSLDVNLSKNSYQPEISREFP